MKPKPGKQLTLFNNIQNTNYNDGNYAADILKITRDKTAIKTDKRLLPDM